MIGSDIMAVLKKCPKCEKKFYKEKQFLKHWYAKHEKAVWHNPH